MAEVPLEDRETLPDAALPGQRSSVRLPPQPLKGIDKVGRNLVDVQLLKRRNVALLHLRGCTLVARFDVRIHQRRG